MKSVVDVIIVADSSREEFRTMTQNCIDTVQKSNPAFEYNIIIVESWDGFASSGHRYEGCTVVVPGVPFNYNLFLQYGIAQGSGEWVALCNNDLLFDPEWMVEINYFSKGKVFQSFSPWCPLVHPSRFQDKNNGYAVSYYAGYRIAYEITGWCIIAKREMLVKINLDTRVDFWYSDNIYADELQRRGIKHALVKKSIVTHLGSQTLNTKSKPEWRRLTTGQTTKYKNIMTHVLDDIKIVDRSEGIFTSGNQNYYIDMIGMLYPNHFLKNVANQMSDVFVYDEPGSDCGSGSWQQGTPDDVTDEDIIGFIFTNPESWRELQE